MHRKGLCRTDLPNIPYFANLDYMKSAHIMKEIMFHYSYNLIRNSICMGMRTDIYYYTNLYNIMSSTYGVNIKSSDPLMNYL